MKIEKIKNYNQKLLAALGTVLLLIAIIGLGIIILEVGSDIYRSLKRNDQIGGIISDDGVKELQDENKRKQLISYDSPTLVDTINSIYVIPVSHITLDKAEGINGLLNYESALPATRYGTQVSNEFYGQFMNLLIYDERKGEAKQLIDNRINFEKYEIKYFEDDVFILFKASDKDSHKDGIVDLRDLTSLFLYSLKEGKLYNIGLENRAIKSYDFVNDSKDLLIQFGIDHNNDGSFNAYNEPVDIKKYVFETGNLEDVINNNIDQNLQKLLEGSDFGR